MKKENKYPSFHSAKEILQNNLLPVTGLNRFAHCSVLVVCVHQLVEPAPTVAHVSIHIVGNPNLGFVQGEKDKVYWVELDSNLMMLQNESKKLTF